VPLHHALIFSSNMGTDIPYPYKWEGENEVLKASEYFPKESSSETFHRCNSCIMELEIMRENQRHHCNLHITIATAIRTTQIQVQIFCSEMKTSSSNKVLSPSVNLSAQ